MKPFLDNFLENEEITPPDRVTAGLKKNFEGAKNVDWIIMGDHFEAIFYKDSIEHLALFDEKGSLLEYKMNLSEDYLPLPALSALPSNCEIMNVVLNNHGNSITYEVIYRDKELKRYIMLLDEIGKIIEQRGL